MSDLSIAEMHSPMDLLPVDKFEAYASRKTEYKKNSPFPHIVFDDFMDVDILSKVLSEFPGYDEKEWKNTSSDFEIKTSFAKPEELGPVTWKLICALNSSVFLDFLTKLTGIKGLISDPYLRGGGLHQILPGGKLGVHADFNFFKKLKVYRRLNLLIYLNKPWDEEWGGNLELWDADMKNCEKAVLPIFNRAVIFSTFNKSFHGHPKPLACPEGHSRKSLALYYYTVDYPYEDDMEPHTTIFRETPDGD